MELTALESAVRSGSGDARIEALVDLSWALLRIDPGRSRALAEEADEADSPSPLRTRALICRSVGEWGRSEFALARELANDALRLMPDADDHPWNARALNAMGAVATRLLEFSDAAAHFTLALEIVRRHGDDLSGPLCNVAHVLIKTGHLGDAMEHLSEALDLARAARDPINEANILSNLANIHHYLGSNAVALEMLDEAAAVYQRLGIEASLADVLQQTATVYAKLEQVPDALRFSRRAIDLFEKHGKRVELAYAYCTMAGIHAATHDLPSARKAYERSMAIGEETGHRGVLPDNLAGLASLRREQGDPGGARDYLRQGLEFTREFGLRAQEASILLSTGRDLLAAKEFDAAESALRGAVSFADAESARSLAMDVERALADLHLAKGEPGPALDHLRRHGVLLSEVRTNQADQRLRGLQVLHRVAEHRQRTAASQRRVADELRALPRRVLAAQEAERRVVARELHDDVVQRLAAVAIELGGVDDKRTRAIQERLKDLSRDVHLLSRRIHPTILTDLGMARAARAEAARVAETAGWDLQFTADRMPDSPSEEAMLTLYRMLQVALRNAGRHACADVVRVALSAGDGVVQLVVEDDGCGFDPDEARNGSGLDSMRERVALCGGRIDIQSAPHQGTRVSAWVPVR